MKRTSTIIQDEIDALTNELNKAKAAELLIAALPVNQQVAIHMHDAQCHWNHTDGCGWMYGIRNGVHDWLEKANVGINRLERNGFIGDDVITIVKSVF